MNKYTELYEKKMFIETGEIPELTPETIITVVDRDESTNSGRSFHPVTTLGCDNWESDVHRGPSESIGNKILSGTWIVSKRQWTGIQWRKIK